MAYFVQYGSGRYDIGKHKKLKWGWIGFVSILLVYIVLQIACPSEMKRFRQAAFPFFEPEVQRSFTEMAKNIREGSTARDAIKVFCEEVFREGFD